jgi:hypothetical protein
MELSVGDKVRVYFYPPDGTQSFVEGVVERGEMITFRGLSFSLKTTREVILGHEIPTSRGLPYIIAYAKEDDFEGRIEVLEPAVVPTSEPRIKAEIAGEADHVARTEPEFAEEPGPAVGPQAEVDIQHEPGKWGWKRLFNRAA